ncbi:MAG: hypothetical protein U1F50_18300 [Rubrivivax sp.]
MTTPLQRYRKRPDHPVVAVRIDLETEGFAYRKWGGLQQAKAGDWLVDNAGDCYTVDGEVFARTYRRVAPGQYVKATPVWARVAEAAGAVQTKEGVSHYAAGDMIVSNQPDGGDAWCMTAERFHAMYEPFD